MHTAAIQLVTQLDNGAKIIFPSCLFFLDKVCMGKENIGLPHCHLSTATESVKKTNANLFGYPHGPERTNTLMRAASPNRLTIQRWGTDRRPQRSLGLHIGIAR